MVIVNVFLPNFDTNFNLVPSLESRRLSAMSQAPSVIHRILWPGSGRPLRMSEETAVSCLKLLIYLHLKTKTFRILLWVEYRRLLAVDIVPTKGSGIVFDV